MIQKVIYRRKAESLAPGRSGCLITFFSLVGGGEMSGAAAGDRPVPPPPPGLVPIAAPIASSVPSFSCSQRWNFLFSMGD